MLCVWCPGCDDVHGPHVAADDGSVSVGPVWDWDRNLDAPTLNPSIKVTGVQWQQDSGFYKPEHARVAAGGEIVCHSYLHGGRWQFLSDCTHAKAGQENVEMVPVPEWLVR